MEMERNMRLHEDILRFMTIKVEELEAGPSVAMRREEREGNERGPRGDCPDRGERSERFERAPRPPPRRRCRRITCKFKESRT